MKDKSSTLPTVLSSREALALATFLTAGHAAAQAPATADKKQPGTSGETLPEVQVTANRQNDSYKVDRLASEKFTAPLVDTPQTVTVIPKEVYTQQNAKTLTDVLKNTPGISFNAGENGFGTGLSSFSMRGMSTSGSIFVDGVRDSGNYMRDVFNLEQVEVVKGAAADNGRGTAGGYVNLVTKTPDSGNFYAGTASLSFTEYGNTPNFRTSFDINQSIGNTPLEGTAFRLNALFQEGGVAGRQWAEANSWGIAPSVTIGLGTPTRFTLAYQHVEQNDIPDWGVPTGVQTPATGFQSAGMRDRRDVFYGLKTDHDDVISDSVLAIYEQDFANGLKLTNQTRWAYTERDAIYTVPTGFVAGNPAQTNTQKQVYYRENEGLSNLTNLSYEFETGSLKHTLSAGLELSYETSDANRYGTQNSNGHPTNDPDPNRPVADPAFNSTNDVTIETVAAYLYDTIELNEQWQITGGLRLEHYRVDIENAGVGVAGYPESRTTLGGKLGLVYKPAENGSIYTSAGISAQPPGSYLSNADISRTPPNDLPNNRPDARTQENINLEFGTKWNFFNDRLSTSAALFYTDRQNVPVDTAGGTFSYTDQIVYGLELGVAGQITENWNIFAGLLVMDSQRKNGSNIDNFRSDDPGVPVDGDELAFTPNYTANLWTTYRFPVGLTIGGGLQYVSSSYVGRPDDAARVIYNGKFGKLPDYLVFNAMVAYEISDNITVRLNVDNLFDDVYAVSTNWNGARSMLGAPRTYTISADWKF